MNIPYIPGKGKYTFFLNGVTREVKEDNALYADIVAAVNAGDEKTLTDLLKATIPGSAPVTELKKIVEETIDKLTLKLEEDTGACTVIYNNQVELPQCLADLLVRLWRDGCKSFAHYSKFIENLLANPNKSSRESLFDFLAIQQLPITENGTFIAYKGLSSNMYSVNGNKNTRVVVGTVDAEGHILNTPGSLIRVLVEDVCADRSVGCASGLHVGSYSYAHSFGSVTVAVEVNPMHVVSVPHDCGFQKCRVSEYTVLHKIDREFKTAEVKVSENKLDTKEVTKNENARAMSTTSLADVDKTINRDRDADTERVTKYLATHFVSTKPNGTGELRSYNNAATIRQLNKAIFKDLTAQQTAQYVAALGFCVMTCKSEHPSAWVVSKTRIIDLI